MEFAHEYIWIERENSECGILVSGRDAVIFKEASQQK
jgi:hypothetical protein